MKILLVQESDWLHRNPIQSHHMLERLSLQGHQVHVVDYPIRWRDEPGGLISPRRVYQRVSRVVPGADVTVIRTASLRVPVLGKLVWLATNVREIRRELRVFQPDVVIGMGLTNSLAALVMARHRGIRYVMHLVDALHTLVEPAALRPLARVVERAILRHADCVVVINNALGAYAAELGAPPDRIVKVPTGVDLERFGPHVDGSRVRAELGVAPDDTLLVFVGWLYEFSGVREVAEALIAGGGDLQNVRLLVVGDGDLLPELRRMRGRDLSNRLILAGRQLPERIPEYLAAADACILPAHPNAVMRHIVPAKVYEYLAARKPVIASALPGLRAEFCDPNTITYVHDLSGVIGAALSLRMTQVVAGAQEPHSHQTIGTDGDWNVVTSRFLELLWTHQASNSLAS